MAPLGLVGCVSVSGPAPAEPLSPAPVAVLQPPEKDKHGHDGDGRFRWDALKVPAAAGEPVALENENDPVTRHAIPPGSGVTLNYKGYEVRFEDALSRWRFEGKPLKYLNQLNLEPHVDGTVERVDASAYRDAAPAVCTFMPSEIDPFGSVYVLHRGWKVYFCCWTGCGDGFLQDPARHYAHYGLTDVGPDRPLVRAGAGAP